ncbi:unnamed protein product [Alternaria alternata]
MPVGFFDWLIKSDHPDRPTYTLFIRPSKLRRRQRFFRGLNTFIRRNPPQPTATQYPPKTPLCVLPFGDRKEKTLCEMPETHFAFLCVTEMWRLICPCVENALRMMGQGFIILIWIRFE